ncbi:HEAT repeat-containing protein 6 [Galendromus occidentalis]|uniref:HEAT repeat-containing protein 6 n=1 Tax=Galendromus occidentalis TaxID=34638 RepID=A0AAJ7P929_9ACAR|nr:HEAT repeat-containing protein 6 [Galendromus occidentalis]
MTENKAAAQTLLLVESLKVLKNSRSQHETEETIQSLLKLDFEVPFCTSDVGEDLLRICVLRCEQCPSMATAPLKELIWLFQTSTENQINLSPTSIDLLVKFCLKRVLSGPIPQIIVSFHALGSLVYQNSHLLDSNWPALHEVLRRSLCDNEDVDSIRHSALKILQSLTIRRDKETGYLSASQVDAIVAMIIEGVIKKTNYADETLFCKIRVATMKTLLNLVNSDAVFQAEHMGYILGYLRHLTFYGFPGYASRPIKSFDLFPSPVCHQLPHIDMNELDGNRDKPVMRRSHGKKQNNRAQKSESTTQLDAQDDSDSSPSRKRYLPWTAADSSDADTSDPENAQDALTLNKRLRNMKAKVRQIAYDTIRMLLLTINKKERFGYLLNFLPQQSSPALRSTEHTLVLSMLKDPDARVRSSSINVLKDFIANSKQYIILACESTHATSFTSISEVMASVITELHRAIHLALLAETLPLFQIPLLSCLSLLTNASPYNRLRASIVMDMIGDLRKILTSKFEQVRVAALTCLGGFAAYQPRHTEIIRCLGLDSDHWLEVYCSSQLLGPEIEANSVRVEILQTLTAFVSNHFNYCIEVFGEIYVPVLESVLVDPFGPIRIHGMKLVTALANKIADSSSTENELVMKLGKSMWQETLFQRGLIQKCIFPPAEGESDRTPHEVRECQVLRRETFTALAEIGSVMWDNLPHSNQKFCICALLTHAKATTDDVALAAIRTLGIFCTYDGTAFDTILLQDVGEMCVHLLGKRINLSLKQKVSWTLSNVCFALWTLCKAESVRFLEEISPEFFNNLLRLSIVAYDDKDAVRVNALRAMGLLLGMVTESYMHKEIQLYKEAVRLLMETMALSSDKFFKAKWNACYAIGWILRNPTTRVLVNIDASLETLEHYLLECINLKVQIACISALDQLTEAHDLPVSVHTQAFSILLRKTSRVSEIQVSYKELKHLQSVKENLSLAVLNYLSKSDQEVFRCLPTLMTEYGECLEILLKDSLSNLDVKRTLEDFMKTPRATSSSQINKFIIEISEHMPEYSIFEAPE